jgi:mono/diheme cytochrome c family protein
MICADRTFANALAVIGILLVGSGTVTAAERGDQERGRAVFNGKGICYYCHGTDGRLEQRPTLSKETAGVIARLAPNPPDLRNLKNLRLKSDRERFRAIREGHPGTGMLPDTTLTDQEITDAVAYLATLRHE